MDVVQDWADYLFSNHAAISAYGPYARQAFRIANLARSYVLALIDQVSRKPDLATIALLVVVIFISLKIVNMLAQTVLFWFRLARKVIWWGGLVALGLWMYTRGPEGAMEDVEYWWNVWNKDYEYWKERERAARVLGQQQGMGGRGRGNGGSWF